MAPMFNNIIAFYLAADLLYQMPRLRLVNVRTQLLLEFIFGRPPTQDG